MMVSEQFVLERFEAQPIADQNVYWIRDLDTGRLEKITISTWDIPTDVSRNSAVIMEEMAFKEMRRRLEEKVRKE